MYRISSATGTTSVEVALYVTACRVANEHCAASES